MKIINNIIKYSLVLVTAALLATSCNKLELDPTPVEQPAGGTGATLATLLTDPSYSLLKTAAERAGLIPLLGDTSLQFTVFAPDNAAIVASLGVPNEAVAAGYLASLPDAVVTALVSYHIIPQKIKAASISQSFPNFGYPTILNPTVGTPKYNALARLTNFPSRRGAAAWVNNIPVIATDIPASNGVVHKLARILTPPSTPVWSKIDSDTTLAFLKAAIQRADSGTTAVAGTLNTNNLQSVLSEFGPQVTLFAPTNAAFRTTLYGLAYPLIYQQIYSITYQTAINNGAPATLAATIATDTANVKAPPTTVALTSTPAVFQNPAFFAAFPAQTVKGIVVYHLLGSIAFSVNLPATATAVPTFLNSAVPSHPGVTVSATFTGPLVSAATVKGLRNATAANVQINPLPGGSSDQLYFNGVVHKIDQVLLPQ